MPGRPSLKLEIPVFASLLLAVFLLSLSIHRNFSFPFPPFNTLVYDFPQDFAHQTSYDRPLGADGSLKDLASVLLGARRFAADVAWVSVLQYYGTHHIGTDEHARAEESQTYPILYKMVLRVVRLDPSFYDATLIGAGALAFNLDRPEEALRLLEEGIRHNPTYWRFRLYVGAILYKQAGKFDRMIVLLEDAVRYPDCPTMAKSILAGIYKERKNYARALGLWMEIYENERTDAWYREQAEKQITDLRKKLGI